MVISSITPVPAVDRKTGRFLPTEDLGRLGREEIAAAFFYKLLWFIKPLDFK
jgi:hypothetical protein